MKTIRLYNLTPATSYKLNIDKMKKNTVGTTSLLALAPILISLGMEKVDTQPWVGLILILVGVGVLVYREYLKIN